MSPGSDHTPGSDDRRDPTSPFRHFGFLQDGTASRRQFSSSPATRLSVSWSYPQRNDFAPTVLRFVPRDDGMDPQACGYPIIRKE